MSRNTNQIEKPKGPIMNADRLAVEWLRCQRRRVGVLAVALTACGAIDDLLIGKDRVLFGILQVGGFLGIGSHFVAVPYQSLQIDEAPTEIVLPGASKEALKNLPEFKYHA
jgi:hypothetical protein